LALAIELRDAPVEAGLRRIVELHGQGWTLPELFAGIYVAGAIGVGPSMGGNGHCTMMVSSALSLAEASERKEALSAVLFNYSNFKASRNNDSFQLPPAPATTLAPAEAASVLGSALRAWDAEAADRAAVAAARADQPDELFEELWLPGVNDFESTMGHKIIATAQAHRLLERVGFGIAEPLVRSLIIGLLRGRELGSAVLDANRERAAAFDPDWAQGREDPEASRELLQALRTVSVQDAPEVVVGMIRKGVGAASLWDGMRVTAAEVVVRAGGGFAVHALTCVNAMVHAASRTRRDETRRLMLLTAASWVVTLRGDPTRHVQQLHLDQIEATEPRPAAELFASGDDEAALSCALATTSTPAGRKAFLDGACRQVLRKGDETHYYKYAAAVREEVEKVHPRWAPHLLAAHLSYLPKGADTAEYRKWRKGEYESG
jgi:hypothetical protein